MDIRNIVGATFTVEKGDIDKRERRDKSIMPVLAYLD